MANNFRMLKFCFNSSVDVLSRPFQHFPIQSTLNGSLYTKTLITQKVFYTKWVGWFSIPIQWGKKVRKYNEQYNFLRRKSIKLMKSGFIICMVRVVPNQSFVQHMHDLQNGIHAFFSLCSKRLMCFRQCVQQRMKYVGFSFFHSNLRNGSDKFCSKLCNGWSKQKSLWTIDKNFLKSKITNASELFSAEKNGKNWRKNTTSDWK